MEKLFALSAPTVIFVTAVIANVDSIAVSVDSERNFIGEKIFVALVAKQVFVVKAVRANVGAVVNNGHLAFIMVLLAMFAKAVVLVQAMIADMNALAVAIDDFPSFGVILVAFRAVFIFFVVAGIAVKPAGNFVAATNTQAVSPDLEDFEVVEMIFANGDFGVKIGMRPVGIAAETFAAGNVNVAFVAAIFLCEPEIWSVFKFGKFTLNEVAVKFGFSLRTASAAACFIQPTLEQKPVVRFVNEDLTGSLAVVESFGLVRVSRREDDERVFVAGVAGTAAVVLAIGIVEGMATDQSVSAFVVFRIRHGEEMRGVNRQEQLEVDFLVESSSAN